MTTTPKPKSPSVRRVYTKEYKQEALRLAGVLGVSKAARDLGLSDGVLYGWRKAAQTEGGDAFRGQGNPTAVNAEIIRLKRENAILRQEREILKKAAEFWVRERS